MQSSSLWATASFFQGGWLPSAADPDSTVGVSLLAAAAGLVLWYLVLLWLGARDGRFRIDVNIQKQHYIQAFCHFSIYVYLGLYWPGIGHYAPLIAAQIVFAYFFEMLLSWSRGRVWQLRLGPFPIVFSINFFMWFREPYFYLQLLMIVFAYLAKEYITWTWEGRTRHIFNPSGITLTVVGLILLSTGTGGTLTYGYDLAGSFYLPPNLYEVIFLLGLIVMFFFSTTLITLGSFVALWLLYAVPDLSQHAVDVYVFLGLTFLLTDPSTSPRSNGGKFLFGLAYGCLIFVADVSLRLLELPSYYDKIFSVPILNLLAPRFQVLGERFERMLSRPWLPPLRHAWAVYLAFWVGTFIAFIWTCKADRENFIGVLPSPSTRQQTQSTEMYELRVKNKVAKVIYPEVYAPFGFRQEIAHLHELRNFEPRTAMEHDSYGAELARTGATERALAHFRQALAIDPSCAAAYRDIGIAFLVDNKPDEALKHLRRAEALDPLDSDTQFGLGVALRIQAEPEKAIQHLQQAVHLNPSSFKACFHLSEALIASGRPDDAVPYLRRAAALSPRDRQARQLLDQLEGQQLHNLALPTQGQPKG